MKIISNRSRNQIALMNWIVNKEKTMTFFPIRETKQVEQIVYL